MPKKVHDCAMKLIKKGYDEASAWAICYASYNRKKRKKKRKK